MKFSADGNRTLFQLMEDNIDSVDSVFIGPDEQEPGADYTVDLENGDVVFLSPPSKEQTILK